MFDDENRRCANSAPNASISLRDSQGNPITERERSCQCTGPLLRSPEGTLLHRYICQANKDSPPNEVCQEREFRTDNPPWQPLLAQPGEEVKGLLLQPAVCLSAVQDHSD